MCIHPIDNLSFDQSMTVRCVIELSLLQLADYYYYCSRFLIIYKFDVKSLRLSLRTICMFSIYYANLRAVHLFNLAISKFHHTNQYFKLEIFTSSVVSLEFTTL